MKRILIATLLIFSLPTLLFSQGSPLEINVGTVTTGAGGVVDVPLTAGTNWSNITTFGCTFTYDPTMLTWNSVQNWALSNPGGISASATTPGILTFSWSSLITIGPSLPNGGLIGNLRFNVIGSIGDTSPVNITNSPTNTTWGNGFGWSGSTFNSTNGQVDIACLVPISGFTSTSNYFAQTFTNTSANGTTYLWDFGDGNTSTTASPTHTYATAAVYTVCLTATSVCGTDSICQTVNVCPNPPQSFFSDSINQLTAIFTDQSLYAPITWLWDFGDGNTSTMQNPTH